MTDTLGPATAPWVQRALPKPPPSLRRELTEGGVVALVLTLLGAPLGLIWAHAVPHLAIVKIGSPAYLYPTRAEDLASMGGDLVMVGVLAGVGIVAGLAIAVSQRAVLGPLIGLIAGGMLCGVIAMAVGHILVSGDYHAAFAHIGDGTVFQVRPYVRGSADFLVLPLFGALAVGLAQVPSLWSNRQYRPADPVVGAYPPPAANSGVAVREPGTAPVPPPSS